MKGYRQGRRQKNFQRGNGKNKPKNSTIKPLSTVSVSCMKIQREARALSADDHGYRIHYNSNLS